MKKLGKIILLVLCIALGLTIFACGGGEKEITIIAREAGSGTRDAFDGLVKNAAGDSLAKKADGTAQAVSVFDENMIQYNSTAAVLTNVAKNKTAIGYISLGSVNDTIKVLNVGGVVPSAATVLDNTYKLQRPFVIMTKKGETLTALAANFLSYLNSTDAQTIIETEKFVQQVAGKGTYTALAAAAAATDKVVIKGSTSVDPLMKKLIAAYVAKNTGKVTASNFDIDAQGSSAGISAVKAASATNVIGMSSSALKDADAAVIDNFNISLDAIAIIVHKDNKEISDITITQLFDVYTGAIKKFSALK